MSAAKSDTLQRMVRRWWAMAVYLAVCAAWVGWCLHDASAGMFWPALAAASIPVVLSCAPNAAADLRRKENDEDKEKRG
jgi:hypothetical protein